MSCIKKIVVRVICCVGVVCVCFPSLHVITIALSPCVVKYVVPPTTMGIALRAWWWCGRGGHRGETHAFIYRWYWDNLCNKK